MKNIIYLILFFNISLFADLFDEDSNSGKKSIKKLDVFNEKSKNKPASADEFDLIIVKRLENEKKDIENSAREEAINAENRCCTIFKELFPDEYPNCESYYNYMPPLVLISSDCANDPDCSERFDKDRKAEYDAYKKLKEKDTQFCLEFKKNGSAMSSELKAKLDKINYEIEQEYLILEKKRIKNAQIYANQIEDKKKKIKVKEEQLQLELAQKKAIEEEKRQKAIEQQKAEREEKEKQRELWCLQEIAKGHHPCGCDKYIGEDWLTCDQ